MVFPSHVRREVPRHRVQGRGWSPSKLQRVRSTQKRDGIARDERQSLPLHVYLSFTATVSHSGTRVFAA